MDYINRHKLPIAKFVKHYSAALEEYLYMQYKDEGHVLDLMMASAEFFSVSYHTVDATLDIFDYTQNTTTQDVNTEQETSHNTSE